MRVRLPPRVPDYDIEIPMIFAHFIWYPDRPLSLFVILTILFCILFWLFLQYLSDRKIGCAILAALFLAIVFFFMKFLVDITGGVFLWAL